MSQTEIQTKLSRIADDLTDIAELLPENDAKTLRRASYAVDDVRLAVGALVNEACHANGLVGPVGYEILGEREIRRAA